MFCQEICDTFRRCIQVKVNFKDGRFNYESLLSISKAGAGLFKSVNAVVNYHAVAKTVEPKRKKVAVVNTAKLT
jgi:hypothetical protein